jgi:hypothetical protein
MKTVKVMQCCLLVSQIGFAQESNPEVKKVYVIFKTHLDIGYTDLSSKVEQQYIDNFIPKAIAIAEQLRTEGGNERYVWTTGSWLISARTSISGSGEKTRRSYRPGRYCME